MDPVVFICLLMQHSSAASFASLSAINAVYASMRFDFEQGSLIPCLCSLHDLVRDRFEQRPVALVCR